jgi:hypothetical protein
MQQRNYDLKSGLSKHSWNNVCKFDEQELSEKGVREDLYSMF